METFATPTPTTPFEHNLEAPKLPSKPESLDYSDGASSGSLDTIATQKTKPDQPTGRRRRAMTVTQQGRPTIHTSEPESESESEGEYVSDDESTWDNKWDPQPDNTQHSTSALDHMSDIQHQIHGLQDISSSIIEDSDSDSEDIVKQLSRQSQRSTVSSLSSFVSSDSKYDMLLARLGTRDTNSPEARISDTEESQQIPTSLDYDQTNTLGKGDEEFDWDFWSKVIADFNSVAKSEPKVLSYHIQRGIPPSVRCMVWELLTKSKDPQLEEQYMQLLGEESVYEQAIARDLLRTFPEHDFFQSSDGQEALFNVVKAYSLYDKEVGYSQGLAHVAGPLLLKMPEEEAFCVLVQLMNRYGLRGNFSPQPELLAQRLFQLDGLLADHLPHVRRHFEVQGVQANMYATQWFLTLFTYKFPLEVIFRLYDVIFSEGIDVVFRFSLALLEKNQSKILSLDFDHLIPFLKNDLLEIYDENASLFIHDAFQIKIATKRLEKLSKEYQVEAARANSEAEAIEAMRRQNKALSETVRQLEIHITDLNKGHKEVATDLISTKMEIARFHDENDALRQQSYDLKKALETMPFEVEQRVKDEMEILATKNAALVERNSSLEDQLVYMENMVIDIKVKYADSENERETLRQRLSELKRLMG